MTGEVDTRRLSQAEIAYLQRIYGDSIDYSEVTVLSGGVRESRGLRAHVVGDDIFMPDDFFKADGSTLFSLL